jgi:carbon storage regulator
LGETIVIGDNIVIKIVSIHGKQIRIGIEAPAEVSVYRGEIYERIKAENEAAAAASQDTLKQVADAMKKPQPEQEPPAKGQDEEGESRE